MKIFRQNTTLVQSSELWSRLDEALRLAKTQRVVIEKNHKPVAVLVDHQQFEEMEQALETLSDLMLALEAKAREASAKPSDCLSLESVEKRLRK